jgi:hypothetical protein
MSVSLVLRSSLALRWAMTVSMRSPIRLYGWLGPEAESKRFFFEKKKQKTFDWFGFGRAG